MRGIVLCEQSGIVSAAFRARGIECWSCDLVETEGDADYHVVGYAIAVAYGYPWDFAIMHPECTHTAVSGARHFAAKQADGRQQRALGFIKALWRAPIRHKALEQPVSISAVAMGRRCDQVIQPWQFGHGETKATCLWLNDLPPLQPTNIVAGREPRVHRMAPGPNRTRDRSRTYTGIADAMADQWGDYLIGFSPVPALSLFDAAHEDALRHG
jgi:hypothetical protein